MKPFPNFRGLLCLILWAICILPTGCGEPPAPPPSTAVTVQLKWVHQAQFAGFYVARENGYYRREDLDVRFIEGGQGVDSAQPLIDGRADFAVLAPEDILIGRGQGKPLVAIAAIYRRSAVVFVSRAESGIVRPADFPGKIIAAKGKAGAVRDFELQLYALMHRQGIDIRSLQVTPYDPKYTGLINGGVDITPAYLTGGVIKLRQKGLKLNIIWPGDYGIHFYSDTLVTTESMVKQHPRRVSRFLRATLQGWQDAVGDPPAAVQTTLKYVRVKDERLQIDMMDALLPLVNTGEDRIGWMKAEDWVQMHRIMNEQGILPGPLVDLDRVHTMRFLLEIYGVDK